ncbi:DUF5067 domain-containing protein [Lactobacillus sp. DCY120]|uniref:DUF5067 domain-containing protein n=1 Tax=Bombilactobacillus apium TaxID=2675299 RepID=A0A850QZ38_9LACO|nr:DUF5067 domain-containing protein [Bombilactobacillus apium]NVY96019.1 DUF5067 domain-containing protein [Bombilactobacillus apium]
MSQNKKEKKYKFKTKTPAAASKAQSEAPLAAPETTPTKTESKPLPEAKTASVPPQKPKSLTKPTLANKPAYPSKQEPDLQLTDGSETTGTPTVGARASKNQHNSQRGWHKTSVKVTTAVIILLAILAGLFWWYNNYNQSLSQDQTTSQSVAAKPKKKSASTKSKTHSKTNQTPSKTTKKTAKKDDQRQAQKLKADRQTKDDHQWKNPGSYDNMNYETDDFSLKLDNSADGVKLIADKDQKPGLVVLYHFKNKSQKPQKPADLIKQDLELKQKDQVLQPTTPKDNQAINDKLNAANQDVAPDKEIDAALMFAAGNDKDDITMSFRNLKTKKFLDIKQPFKLQ